MFVGYIPKKETIKEASAKAEQGKPKPKPQEQARHE